MCHNLTMSNTTEDQPLPKRIRTSPIIDSNSNDERRCRVEELLEHLADGNSTRMAETLRIMMEMVLQHDTTIRRLVQLVDEDQAESATGCLVHKVDDRQAESPSDHLVDDHQAQSPSDHLVHKANDHQAQSPSDHLVRMVDEHQAKSPIDVHQAKSESDSEDFVALPPLPLEHRWYAITIGRWHNEAKHFRRGITQNFNLFQWLTKSVWRAKGKVFDSYTEALEWYVSNIERDLASVQDNVHNGVFSPVWYGVLDIKHKVFCITPDVETTELVLGSTHERRRFRSYALAVEYYEKKKIGNKSVEMVDISHFMPTGTRPAPVEPVNVEDMDDSDLIVIDRNPAK